MKKIYSILTLFVASLLGLAAQAETRTVTFHVDDPSRLQPLEMYGSEVTIAFGDDNTAQVTFGEESGTRQVNITAADDCKIISVKKASGNEFKSSYTVWPNPSSNSPASKIEFAAYDSYYGFDVEDGEVINIETIAVQPKIFTFKANPEHFAKIVQFSTIDTPSADGVWTLDVTDTYRTVYFYLKEQYNFSKVTDSTGKELQFNNSNHYFYVSPSNYSASETFTVESYNLDESRSATATITIDGNPADVTLLRAGEVVKLEDVINEVKFNPETESEFTLRHKTYSTKRLASVKLDGTNIEPEGTYYEFKFSPVDGSEVEVAVESDIDVPVKFEFTNPGTEGALSRITCNNVSYSNEQCLADGFSLKLYSTFSVECNETDFEIDGVYYNGVYGYSGRIMSEDEYVVTITAQKPQMKELTIKCDAWEHINLEDDWYNAITLTGPETVVSFKTIPEYFVIEAIDDYVINSATDEATGDDLLNVGSYDIKIRNLKEGMTIVVEASKFERNKEMVVFLEDIEWTYQNVYLADRTEHEEIITLTPGYNHIMFSSGDFNDYSFSVEPTEGTTVMYLNDELVEMEYNYGYSFPVGLDKIKAGDVLKIFAEEKTPHQVTYQVAEDVNADIFHDHIVAVAEPATHAVLPGTEIHIKPAAAKTRSAVSGLIVKVNDETVEPAANGVYTITADGDKTISVANDPSTSIVEISADGKVKAYDLMGRKVNANHRGLTIINGKKVMK